jgi:hypothetical protein
LLLELQDWKAPVYSVAFSPDGALLAAASAKAVRVYAGLEPGKYAVPASQP